MHFLLTNDDGYEAAGLAALYRAIGKGHQVSVAAPFRERSSCGHSATLSRVIPVHRVRHSVLGEVFAVEGTPVDCVRLALSELIEKPVDWVISGINLGANASAVDVHTSGTVAAAREGAMCGIGGIAVSQMYLKGQAADCDRASRIMANLLPQIVQASRNGVRLWNVNLPALPAGEPPKGVCVVPLANDHVPLVYERTPGGGAREAGYEYRGYFETRQVTEGTDLGALFAGKVAITPLSLDATGRSGLEHDFGFRL